MTSVRIDFNVEIPMRDRTVLRADVYIPEGDGPWPVLVSRGPYGKAFAPPLVFDPIAAAQRGFIVVMQDTRGRGTSDGEWLPWAHEHEDGYDTIEWAAKLHGSDGNVGTWGMSYLGNTQWTAAMRRPPSLKAIAPMATWWDPDDGLFFRGGALELGLNAAWTPFTALLQARFLPTDQQMSALVGAVSMTDQLPSRGYWELPSGDLPSIRLLGVPDIGLQRALQDPTASEKCRVRGHESEIDVPALLIGGWWDIFCQGPLDAYAALRAQRRDVRLIMGPWQHTRPGESSIGGADFGVAAGGNLPDVHLGFFDQHLRGIEPPAARGPVQIFVMGANEWRDEAEWPLSRAVPTDYYLHSAGFLSRQPAPAGDPADSYPHDPANPVMTAGGAMLLHASFPSGPADQRATEERDDVLVFTSDALTQDTEVTGPVTATLFAATTAASTDWVMKLCDVDEDGTSLNVTDGITRVLATPGTAAEHRISLWSTSMLFKAGHRIRVQVASSNFPRWDRNPGTGESPHTATELVPAQQTVYHDASRPSRITLPVVPVDAVQEAPHG